MCLIAVKESGKQFPKDEHLLEAEIKNKDGIGLMYWKPGAKEIKIKKDFTNAETMIAWMKENIAIEDILVIHYRWATHGLVDIGNRHPFPVSKNALHLRSAESVCDMGMAHNGVMSQFGTHKKFSDTQQFVREILSEDSVKNNLTNPGIAKLIDNFLGGDRLVVLTKDGELFYWGEWEKEGDIFYSNDGYKKKVYEYFSNWYAERVGNYLNNKIEYKNRQDNATESNESWIELCEGCGQEKHVKFVEANGHVGFSLCKSCRKAYGKGKLKVEDFYISSELVSEAPYDPDEDIQCDSCYDWVKMKDASDFHGNVICKKCKKDVDSYNLK